MGPAVREWLTGLPSGELADWLIGGITFEELPFESDSIVAQIRQDFVLPPLPNHMFTRDTSAWIYNGVSINAMAKPAQQRESVHFDAIYRHHPLFGGAASRSGATRCLLRCTWRAVLTMVDHDTFTIFLELRGALRSYRITPGPAGLSITQQDDLFEAIARALDLPKIRLIETGGTGSRPSASNGTTATTSWPSPREWWWPTSETSMDGRPGRFASSSTPASSRSAPVAAGSRSSSTRPEGWGVEAVIDKGPRRFAPRPAPGGRVPADPHRRPRRRAGLGNAERPAYRAACRS